MSQNPNTDVDANPGKAVDKISYFYEFSDALCEFGTDADKTKSWNAKKESDIRHGVCTETGEYKDIPVLHDPELLSDAALFLAPDRQEQAGAECVVFRQYVLQPAEVGRRLLALTALPPGCEKIA